MKRIASGKGKLEKTKIEFAKVNARYIKILQTGSGGNYWSIQELQIFQENRDVGTGLAGRIFKRTDEGMKL